MYYSFLSLPPAPIGVESYLNEQLTSFSTHLCSTSVLLPLFELGYGYVISLANLLIFGIGVRFAMRDRDVWTACLKRATNENSALCLRFKVIGVFEVDNFCSPSIFPLCSPIPIVAFSNAPQWYRVLFNDVKSDNYKERNQLSRDKESCGSRSPIYGY